MHDPLPWAAGAPRGVAGRIAAETARRIVEGSLPPGHLLTEVGLADEFDASRTPAREALLRLEAWGLARLAPKKGALVTAVDPAERHDLLDLRGTWEIRAVELVSAPAAAGDRELLVAGLREDLAAQDAALTAGDLLAYAGADVRFHLRIAAAARNAVVDELLSGLAPRLARMTHLAATTGVDESRTLVAEHADLVDRIAAADVDGFRDRVRRHIADAHFSPSNLSPSNGAAR